MPRRRTGSIGVEGRPDFDADDETEMIQHDDTEKLAYSFWKELSAGE